nr:immunoglobulin heavy chain junction region [Mus musculus]NSM08741.1 immunoglobulin heavy chain junction region [Mus musculus]NSM09441.1 immunoglobulin heavy chain junction region [Mus musculus]
CLTAYSNYGYW